MLEHCDALVILVGFWKIVAFQITSLSGSECRFGNQSHFRNQFNYLCACEGLPLLQISDREGAQLMHIPPGNSYSYRRWLYILAMHLEHRHPSQTSLEIGCRVVQFSLELPHPSAERMNWTTLHPIFSECPAKLRCFCNGQATLNCDDGRIRQANQFTQRKNGNTGFALFSVVYRWNGWVWEVTN